MCGSLWVVRRDNNIDHFNLCIQGISPLIYTLFNFFHQCFILSMCRSFTCLVKFTPKHFYAVRNGWFLGLLYQLVCCYTKMLLTFVCWFCILPLYWIHLLVLISFLVLSLVVYTVVSPFYFFLLNLFSFYFFLLFHFLAYFLWPGFPILCWLEAVMVGILVLFLIIEEKHLAFYQNMMLAVGLSNMAFIVLRYIPSVPELLRVCLVKACWILSKLSYIYWDSHMIFIPHTVKEM